MPSEAETFKGRRLPRQVVVVERSAVANFAAGITDDAPVFHDPRAAREQGLDTIPAPPTFPFVMPYWGAFPELQTDDATPSPVGEVLGTLRRDGGLVLHGEQEFEYARPVVVGDRLTSSGEIEDVYVKESGDKVMTFVVVRTDWHDDDGAWVCTSRMTLIHRR